MCPGWVVRVSVPSAAPCSVGRICHACVFVHDLFHLSRTADDAVLPTLCRGDGSAPADAAAKPGPYWSLMLEVAESSRWKPVDQSPVTVGGQTFPKIVLESLIGKCGAPVAGTRGRGRGRRHSPRQQVLPAATP